MKSRCLVNQEKLLFCPDSGKVRNYACNNKFLIPAKLLVPRFEDFNVGNKLFVTWIKNTSRIEVLKKHVIFSCN